MWGLVPQSAPVSPRRDPVGQDPGILMMGTTSNEALWRAFSRTKHLLGGT